MKRTLATVTLLATLFVNVAPVLALYAVKLRWNPNPESDLAGYKIFHRMEGETYNYNQPAWTGADTTCNIVDLPEGTHYFVARAFDHAGNESIDSDEKSKVIEDTEAPGQPTGFTIVDD